MYALCSIIDGGLMRVKMNGFVISPMFVTADEARLFIASNRIVCNVEFVNIKGAK